MSLILLSGSFSSAGVHWSDARPAVWGQLADNYWQKPHQHYAYGCTVLTTTLLTQSGIISANPAGRRNVSKGGPMIGRPRLVAPPFQQAVSDKDIDPRGPIRRRNEAAAVVLHRTYGVAQQSLIGSI